jgi:hypothetical protein
MTTDVLPSYKGLKGARPTAALKATASAQKQKVTKRKVTKRKVTKQKVTKLNVTKRKVSATSPPQKHSDGGGATTTPPRIDRSSARRLAPS